MASNSTAGNQSITLERNKVITITKKTVRFSGNVYQTHNIARFAEGEVEVGGISWGIVIAAFLLSMLLWAFNAEIAALILIAGIGGTIWNIVKPKHYGFRVTLNSGDETLFVTTDKPGMKRVISSIYEFIEAQKDATFQVSINNSQVIGNIIQGDIGGSASVNNDS